MAIEGLGFFSLPEPQLDGVRWAHCKIDQEPPNPGGGGGNPPIQTPIPPGGVRPPEPTMPKWEFDGSSNIDIVTAQSEGEVMEHFWDDAGALIDDNFNENPENKNEVSLLYAAIATRGSPERVQEEVNITYQTTNLLTQIGCPTAGGDNLAGGSFAGAIHGIFWNKNIIDINGAQAVEQLGDPATFVGGPTIFEGVPSMAGNVSLAAEFREISFMERRSFDLVSAQVGFDIWDKYGYTLKQMVIAFGAAPREIERFFAWVPVLARAT